MTDKFSKEQLEKFWNKEVKSEKPFFNAPSTLYYRRREIDLFQKWFGDLKGKKLIKTDCWNESRNTRILFWAAKEGAECSCFDISINNLNDAKKNMKEEGVEIDFTLGDVRDIPYPDDSFDFAHSIGTIEHTPSFFKSTTEIKRVLKNNSIAMIGVPNKYPWFDPLRYYYMKLLDKLEKFPYGWEKHFKRKEFKEFLEEVGFEVEEQSTILLMPFFLRAIDIYLYRINKKLCFITKPFLWLFEYIERHCKFLRDRAGYLLVCKVRKVS